MTNAPKNIDWNSLRWKHRLFLILSESETSPEVVEMVEQVKRNQPYFEERDLRFVLLVDGRTGWIDGERLTEGSVKRLWQRTRNESQALPGCVLIGKDGGIKLRESCPVELGLIFARIDGMPLRQREMR